MEGFRLLGVSGNRSTRRKATEVGMKSANQTHTQQMDSSSTKPTSLPIGVVCHPDTEQKRSYKIRGPDGV